MSTVKHQIWLITLAQNPFFEWAKKLNYVRIKFKSPKSLKSQPFISSKIIAQNSLFWYFRAGNFRIFNWNELGTFWNFWNSTFRYKITPRKFDNFHWTHQKNLNFKVFIELDFLSPTKWFHIKSIWTIKYGSYGMSLNIFQRGSKLEGHSKWKLMNSFWTAF